MSEKISYNTVLDLLVGDLKTEEHLTVVLNFLEHTASVIRHLRLAQRINRESREEKVI